jgi:glycosyltransferase involved in cell wall biosynthesis
VRLLRASGVRCTLVRISQLPLSDAERHVLAPDEFQTNLTPRQVARVLRGADIMLAPSWEEEGFGLPVLEAMACGRAVACSDTSALPEVVDGAALLFDPYAMDETVRAIADLLLDAEWRSRLERLGLQRAAHFSWQKTAQKTLAVFQEVVERPEVAQAVSPATIAHR